MTTSSQSLLRLMTWLSPAFPTGGFSYSHGLEAAIHYLIISDRESLRDWISCLIKNGSIWNDCVLLAATHGSNNIDEVTYCCELAEAIAGSKERHLETMKQGRAFLDAAAEWWKFEMPNNTAFPVAVGLIASSNNIERLDTLVAYLQAFVTSQIQAALRLMPLGQANGLWLHKELETPIIMTAKYASGSSLDDLGSATFIAEIMTMKHETMTSRIFRS